MSGRQEDGEITEGDAMPKRNIIVELRHSLDIARQASSVPDARLDPKGLPSMPGLDVDSGFAPVPVRSLKPRSPSGDPNDLGVPFELDTTPESTTYVVRGEIEEEDVDALRAHEAVIGVFADPLIEPCPICPNSLPLGDHLDVESLLCTKNLHSCGMDGSGVLVAVVDSGVNLEYLKGKGKTPDFNASWSWAWSSALTPGSVPVKHGTMCAFDVCIAAPKCTLLDIVLLRPLETTPAGLGALLSDAVKAYSHLLDIMLLPRRVGELRSMVVNNSWGMFHPSWDYPPGDPANYSDNPNHPFNKAVGSLDVAGADILFAAGNCGADCPDDRCKGVTSNAIYGASGHPQVLTVAGVDTSKQRVGYSTIGPGRLTHNKPDISGYTHFVGSGVYMADGGTSAATPVVAGVVAAVRSKRPHNPADFTTSPASIRSLVTSTAEDLGTSGFDFQHGHGVVDGCELGFKLCPLVPVPPPPIPVGRPRWLRDICEVYPWICEGVFRWPEIPGPVIRWFDMPGIPFRVPRIAGRLSRLAQPPAGHSKEGAPVEMMLEQLVADSGVTDAVQLGYILGFLHAQRMGVSPSGSVAGTGASSGKERQGGDCDCGSRE